MVTDAEPIVGSWYRQRGKGQRFEVVAVDSERQLVELQHFDGDVEELELGSWYENDIEPVESPQDWSGPVDDFEPDDLHYTETDMTDDDWSDSLSEYRPSAEESRRADQGEPESDEEET